MNRLGGQRAHQGYLVTEALQRESDPQRLAKAACALVARAGDYAAVTLHVQAGDSLASAVGHVGTGDCFVEAAAERRAAARLPCIVQLASCRRTVAMAVHEGCCVLCPRADSVGEQPVVAALVHAGERQGTLGISLREGQVSDDELATLSNWASQLACVIYALRAARARDEATRRLAKRDAELALDRALLHATSMAMALDDPSEVLDEIARAASWALEASTGSILDASEGRLPPEGHHPNGELRVPIGPDAALGGWLVLRGKPGGFGPRDSATAERFASLADLYLRQVRRRAEIERDVTERRRLHQELLRTQRLETVGRLAGGMAHELNNSLAVIETYATLIADEHPELPELCEDLATICETTQQAGALIKRLLLFARRKLSEPRPLDVCEAVRTSLPTIEHLVGPPVELRTALPDEPQEISVDASQLEQCLANLATNARDAMPGGGTLTISVERRAEPPPAAIPSVARADGWVVLGFRDTGQGMDETTRERALEPFYTTHPFGHGMGLGLSVVYGVVTQAGGVVSFDSAPDRGCCVELWFPVQTEP